jgi:dephospho-CoA kinase
MLSIGLTGGIGSGKSVISHLLRLMDIPIYDCDDETKHLIARDSSIRQSLTALVDANLYGPDGLDKQKLASYIFGNEVHLKAVNAIIHPAVRADFIRWTKAYSQVSLIVGMESAILIDAGFEDAVDIIVNVSAPTEVRLRRAVRRDHSSVELIQKRIDSQISENERNAKADYIIYNDDVHPIIPQVYSLINKLRTSINNL